MVSQLCFMQASQHQVGTIVRTQGRSPLCGNTADPGGFIDGLTRVALPNPLPASWAMRTEPRYTGRTSWTPISRRSRSTIHVSFSSLSSWIS